MCSLCIINCMKNNIQRIGERIAILVDCDNVSPDTLDYAVQIAAPLGRIVLRRG